MEYIIVLLLLIIIAELTFVVSRTTKDRTGQTGKQPLFVDTSALMDGRIVTAAQTGFIPGNIVVPRSVINEMQLLADQADSEKRSRARRGLDAVQELKDLPYLTVNVVDDGTLGEGGVDQRLVDLAMRHNGTICTIDFNLNKVASVQGIRVLNINELAGGIRMAFLPGETISLMLNQKGQTSSQAVGYLADGTMVVVDKAAGSLGQTVEVEFIRSLQTAAGRMMFAKLLHPAQSDTPEVKPKGRRSPSPSTRRAPTGNNRAESASNADQPSTNVPDRPAQKRRPTRTPRKSRSGEDSLLDLVNNQ